MPVELAFSEPRLVGLILVLSRMAGLLIFLPIPGLRALPETVRPLVAIALTLPLAARTPPVVLEESALGQMLLGCMSELCFGLLWGLAVHFLVESFVLGAQFLALQAGFGYASMIDPSTQADAGLLQILAQLIASLLFFATGLHREILFLMGESIRRIPPGSYVAGDAIAGQLVQLGSSMFEMAARLSMPLIALLLLIDLSLALLGRVQSQLQLLSMMFPAKLLLSLFVLGLMSATYVRLYELFGRTVVTFLEGVLTLAVQAVASGGLPGA
ncbi:MAG: flagellar biosynthetic protein FliR [Bryobacterales bacterium]|nr:flagellar biosynthetic protein FliR [Bryobacterales bacterium]